MKAIYTLHHVHDYVDLDCDCALTSGEEATTPLPTPTLYALELTPLCQNRCIGCSNPFSPKTSHVPPLSLEEWFAILDRIAPYAQRLKLTGGEPTLYPGFAAFVEEVARRDIPFTLFTNGRWQKPDDIIALARNTSCVGMLVSLHGHNAATHDAFTNTPGSFAETVQNIQRAAEAGITVHTNTVLNRHNANNTNEHVVGEIITLSRQLGATCAVFNRYIGRPIPHLHLPRPALLHALEVVASYQCKGYAVRYGTPMPKEAPSLTHPTDHPGDHPGDHHHASPPAQPLHFYANEGAPCGAGGFSCTIDPWGNLRPCNHAPSITVAGNVLREPLEVIWRSPAMATWRLASAHECHVGNSQNERYCGCRADALLNEHDMSTIG